ncbi:unnamed protein product [Musa hybrid cultivar]
METLHRRSSRDRSVKEIIVVRNQPTDDAPAPTERRSTESNQNAHGKPDRGARIPGSRSKSIRGERANRSEPMEIYGDRIELEGKGKG